MSASPFSRIVARFIELQGPMYAHTSNGWMLFYSSPEAWAHALNDRLCIIDLIAKL